MIDLRGMESLKLVLKPVMSLHRAFKTVGSEKWGEGKPVCGLPRCIAKEDGETFEQELICNDSIHEF
jgi:hypothetical protein